MTRNIFSLISTALILALAGCGGKPSITKTAPSTVSVVPNPPASPALSETSRSVSEEEFGTDWPLIVKRGTVECDRRGAITFNVDGGPKLGLNGTAAKYPPIDVIWKASPDPRTGPKISLAPLIAAGQKLCK
jgi:hypothetical protein